MFMAVVIFKNIQEFLRVSTAVHGAGITFSALKVGHVILKRDPQKTRPKHNEAHGSRCQKNILVTVKVSTPRESLSESSSDCIF